MHVAAVRVQSARRGQVSRAQAAAMRRQHTAAALTLQGCFRCRVARAVAAEKRAAKLAAIVAANFNPASDWLMFVEDGTPFYYNMKTERCCWELPKEGIVGNGEDSVGINRASDWVAHFDTREYRGGEAYFHNTRTGETTWDAPTEGVARIVKASGQSNGRAQAADSAASPQPEPEVRPEQSPAPSKKKRKKRHAKDIRDILQKHENPDSPWLIHRHDGRLYFYNTDTEESAWELPEEGVGGCGEEPTEEFDEGPSPKELRRMQRQEEEEQRAQEQARQKRRDEKEKREARGRRRQVEGGRRQEEIARKVEAKRAEAVAVKRAAVTLQSACRSYRDRIAYTERLEKRRLKEKREREIREHRRKEKMREERRAQEERRAEFSGRAEVLRSFRWQDGDPLEIYSRSQGLWQGGTVTRVQGTVLTINYGDGDAERFKKVDLVNEDLHEVIRPVDDDDEALQALQAGRDSQQQPAAHTGGGAAGGGDGAAGGAANRVTFMGKNQVSPQIAGKELKGMAQVRNPKTYYVYEVWWGGERHEIEKRFSQFSKFDKKIRPLLSPAQKSSGALKKLPSTTGKDAIWRTSSVIDRREKFFQAYLTDVMSLCDGGVGSLPIPRMGDLFREFLGAPEGEIQLIRMSLDEPEREPEPERPQKSAEQERKEREKRQKKAEAAELEQKQREIARREMAEGDLPKRGLRRGGGGAGGGGGAAGGDVLPAPRTYSGAQPAKTKQEMAAEAAAERRRKRREAMAQRQPAAEPAPAPAPAPADDPWEEHEHEGRRYWWHRETEESRWTDPHQD